MLYKPKYCCDCGDKIERVDWNFLASRRFCDVCETRFKIYDKIPLLVIGFGLFFTIAGFGFYLQKAENTGNALPHQIAGNQPTTNKNLMNQNGSPQLLTNQSVQETAKIPENNFANQAQTKPQIALLKQNLPTSKQFETNPTTARETTYFCGAETKKGTPCSRRVKTSGRCWQHAGQPAMLPPEKLIAVQ